MTVPASISVGVVGGGAPAAVDPAGTIAPAGVSWTCEWWIGGDDRWHVPAEEIMTASPMVAEGIRTAGGVVELARRSGVDMPIAGMVGAVIEGRSAPADILGAFMGREAKAELHGIR